MTGLRFDQCFVQYPHRWPVNSPHKGLVTRKYIPFDDIIMYSHNDILLQNANATLNWFVNGNTAWMYFNKDQIYSKRIYDSMEYTIMYHDNTTMCVLQGNHVIPTICIVAKFVWDSDQNIIGILRGYAIRSGRRPEGSQRPQGGPQVRPCRWLPEGRLPDRIA